MMAGTHPVADGPPPPKPPSLLAKYINKKHYYIQEQGGSMKPGPFVFTARRYA